MDQDTHINRERHAPRFSVNSLSEYLVANASRRRRILEEQKRPRDFQVIYYKEAEEAIVRFIVDDRDPASLATDFHRTTYF